MFIVFEGVDGSGKSTQIDLFCQWLESSQQPWVRCADPGSTELGTAIRRVLLRRSDIQINNESEMLLFMAARAQMVDELIRPALAENKIVVCDRFVMSTTVYQGLAGRLKTSDIETVARIATGDLNPDLTFVMDLPFDVMKSRLGESLDRMESRSREYFNKVIAGYQKRAGACPNCYLLDATQSAEDVQHQIQAIAAEKGVFH